MLISRFFVWSKREVGNLYADISLVFTPFTRSFMPPFVVVYVAELSVALSGTKQSEVRQALWSKISSATVRGRPKTSPWKQRRGSTTAHRDYNPRQGGALQ
jgi:hypothetical protein